MNYYDWPPASREEKSDDPGERGRFLKRSRIEFDAEGARAAGIAALQPAAPARGGLRAPALGSNHLWQPLGPMTVVSGQAIGNPRIAGRVNMLAAHPDGDRIYAASANGGVWYSNNGGIQWKALGGYAATPGIGQINRPAQRNACGSIAVVWGATEAHDLVYVGTGETTHQHDAQPGSSLGGIGILRSEHPATSGGPDPWIREANNLLGEGVCRIAVRPGGTEVVAATTNGLYERPAGAGVDTPWTRVTGTPFDTLTDKCSDVLWTKADGARPERLWVWVQGGDSAGLWVRAAGAANFDQIITVPPATLNRGVLQMIDPSVSPDQIFAFNDGGRGSSPLLFRVACATAAKPVATAVAGVPNVLKKQGFYDIAIAVHPTLPNRVVLGGSTFDTTAPDGTVLKGDGAIVMGDIALVTGVLTFTATKMVGVGVHSDIHDLAFSNNGNRLWASCDGGVFCSDHPTAQVGFFPCNDGLAIIESNYVANHPTCEGYVVTGLQDNGVIERISNNVWHKKEGGDGGSVVFDPVNPERFLSQYVQGSWRASDGTFRLDSPNNLLKRGGPASSEDGQSAFYSTGASILQTRGATKVGQIIVGTTRLWYTENFGTPWATPAGPRSWVTLPTGTDPLPGNVDQDAFSESTTPEAITVCRWQSPDVAWALSEGKLMRYARTPGSDSAGGPGKWTRETIIKKNIKNKKDATSADGPIRDSSVWTDIAVNLDPPPAAGQPPTQHGTKGAMYLGTIGKADDDDVDTLWWFDGTSKWFKTLLRKDEHGHPRVPAPVTAIVCDPAFPNEVYVGTTVGVWKGTRTQVGDADPTWGWESRVNGLPEAAVEDLAIFTDPASGLRLLRAAIAARGIWELRLDVADVQDLTYLRAHNDDLRYRDHAISKQRNLVTDRSWHGSPDVRPRRSPLACPPPATLPWAAKNPGIDAEQLRRFQSALRAHTGDRRVRATGKWDSWFNEVMRDLGAPTVGNTVRLDVKFWEKYTTMHPTAEPWESAHPTHADLLDFTAEIKEGNLNSTSCDLPPGPSKIDILVNQRGLNPLDGGEVRVTLLKWMDPQAKNKAKCNNASTWGIGNVTWTDSVNELLNSGATSKPLGSGWSFVGGTPATRSQTLTGQTLDALNPGIASFDLDLTGVKPNTVVVLVAVIRSGADIALASDKLENLAMTRSNVAVRSLCVNGFSVTMGTKVSPFSPWLYPPEMAASAAQNARLATALQTVRATLSAANQARLDKIALIVVKLTPNGTMDYAGVRETEMFFSASLLKVALLYASFELVARVNVLASYITADTPAKFFDKVKKDFTGRIEGAIARIKPGAWRKVSFDKVLTATPAGAGKFTVSMNAIHNTELSNIFADQGNNTNPRNCIHRLGYSYVNRALDAAGFLDALTETGIWIASNFKGKWPSFNVKVATKSAPPKSKNGTSSLAMTAFSMANLLCHMHRGSLIDAGSSTAMRSIFSNGGAWLSTLANPNSFSFTAEGAKVGHSDSGSAFVGSVMSEAVFLKRKADNALFLSVWQNVPDDLDSEPIYRVLDEMIKNWP